MARFPEHVNMVEPDNEHTALHIAAANDHFDVVRLLASMVCTYLYLSIETFNIAQLLY